jgi:hypothetical protein
MSLTKLQHERLLAELPTCASLTDLVTSQKLPVDQVLAELQIAAVDMYLSGGETVDSIVSKLRYLTVFEVEAVTTLKDTYNSADTSRRGQKWSIAERNTLRQSVSAGKTLLDLVGQHKRSVWAILARLEQDAVENPRASTRYVNPHSLVLLRSSPISTRVKMLPKFEKASELLATIDSIAPTSSSQKRKSVESPEPAQIIADLKRFLQEKGVSFHSQPRTAVFTDELSEYFDEFVDLLNIALL